MQPTSAIRGNLAGSWKRVRDIPTPRLGAAAVAFENRIVIIGGTDKPTSVERYDPVSDRWDRLAAFPYPVEFAMAAAIEEGTDAGIFVFGGFTNGVASKRTWYLPRDDDRWREINSMPDTRAAGAAVAIGTKVYIVGGVAQQAKDVQGLALPTFEYDLHGTLGAPWKTKAPIPTPRDELAGAALGQRVCAVGGRQFSVSRNLTAVECYDPATDKWEQLPPLPAPRGGIGAAVVGDRLVVVGGDEAGGPLKTVDVFDAKTRVWSRGPDMPTARSSLSVAAVGDVVYAIGGAGTSGTATGLGEALTLR